MSRERAAALAAMTAAAAATGSLWYLVDGPADRGSGILVLFSLAVAVGQLLPIPNPRGRAIPASVAVIGAYALLGNSPHRLAIMATIGWCLAAVVRFVMGRRVSRMEFVAMLAGAWSLAGLTATGSALGARIAPWAVLAPRDATEAAVHLLAAAGAWMAIILVFPVWETVETTAATGVPAAPVYRGLLRSTWAGSVALSAAATLGALVHEVLGAWTLPLIIVPLLATRGGLSRYAQVRRTYDQTVRAMSRLPEELGSVSRGHGVRVGKLSVAIARELGLPDRQVAQVERAAHLHELGRIKIETGALVPDRALAAAGASVLREAGSLEREAALIEVHREPYRVPGRGDDPSVPIGARIVRTACEFDSLEANRGGVSEAWSALEHLHIGSAYDHDPAVVQALTRVLGRWDVL